MTHRERVARFWDEVVRSWVGGDDQMPDPLPEWFGSYAGTGRGAVTREGFVEPYQGDLLGRHHEPRLVVLGLNPGQYHAEMQSRSGIFAREMVADFGSSFHDWSASCPYTRDVWTSRFGRNRYFTSRIAFAGRWLALETPVPEDLLVFELYPWHSTGVTGRMRPPPEVVDEFVWQPISEFDCEHVFAFGREWAAVATALGLKRTRSLGAGGDDYGSSVPSRAVRVYRLPTGRQLVVEWHSGSAGPPRATETDLLRAVLLGEREAR